MSSAENSAENEGAPGFAMPEPTAEHRWLERFVGTWTMTGHDGVGSWVETIRSIGGLWVIAEGEGEMGGCGRHTTVMTIGFDPAKGRFLGTFLGSMMTHLWIYEGVLDGDRLVLDTVGPDMSSSGGLKRFQDIIELMPDGSRRLTSLIETDDGTWKTFMEAAYSRG